MLVFFSFKCVLPEPAGDQSFRAPGMLKGTVAGHSPTAFRCSSTPGGSNRLSDAQLAGNACFKAVANGLRAFEMAAAGQVTEYRQWPSWCAARLSDENIPEPSSYETF
jgi:hypothetical protein